MTNDISQSVVDACRRLYKTHTSAQAMFDWAAKREKDATATSLDRVSDRLGISRGEAVSLARQLEQAGCGEFIVGRRGQKSRFQWAYSCIALGQAASGEDVELEPAEDPISEREEDLVAAAAPPTSGNVPSLTIAEAKLGLAHSLGVPEASIEITVRA